MKRFKLLSLVFLITYLLFSQSIASNNKLIEAVKKGDLNLVKKMVERGADVNYRDENGNTPLHFAAYYGYIDIVKYLVEKGAYVYASNKAHKLPFYYAFKKKHMDVAKYLKWSMKLIKAVRRGDLKAVKKAIKHGAYINVRDEVSGNTPLQLAKYYEKKYSLKKYEYESDSEQKYENYKNIVEFLKSKGAK